MRNDELAVIFNKGQVIINKSLRDIDESFQHIMGPFQNPGIVETISNEKFSKYKKEIRDNLKEIDKIRKQYIGYANSCVSIIDEERESL